MTNEEILRKMNDDMKMRNFSKYSFYTYSYKGAEMIKYFNKPMEEVTMDKVLNKKQIPMLIHKRRICKVLTKEELSAFFMHVISQNTR